MLPYAIIVVTGDWYHRGLLLPDTTKTATRVSSFTQSINGHVPVDLLMWNATMGRFFSYRAVCVTLFTEQREYVCGKISHNRKPSVRQSFAFLSNERPLCQNICMYIWVLNSPRRHRQRRIMDSAAACTSTGHCGLEQTKDPNSVVRHENNFFNGGRQS